MSSLEVIYLSSHKGVNAFKVQHEVFCVNSSSVLTTAAGNSYDSCFPLKFPICLLTKALLLWNKGVDGELRL